MIIIKSVLTFDYFQIGWLIIQLLQWLQVQSFQTVILTIVLTFDYFQIWCLYNCYNDCKNEVSKCLFFQSYYPMYILMLIQLQEWTFWNLVLVIIQNMIAIQLQFSLRDSNMGCPWWATSWYSTMGASQIMTPGLLFELHLRMCQNTLCTDNKCLKDPLLYVILV